MLPITLPGHVWQRKLVSNQRHSVSKTDALPTELFRNKFIRLPVGTFTPIAYGPSCCAEPSHNIAFFTLIRRQLGMA